jgi:hypothetical protein
MKVTFNQRHHGTLPPPPYGTTPDLTTSRRLCQAPVHYAQLTRCRSSPRQDE